MNILNKKTTIAACCAILMALMLLPGASFAKTYKLKFAHAWSPMHLENREIIIPWTKQIEEATNGQVKIKIYPGGALGKPGQIYPALKKGLFDFGWGVQQYTRGAFPVTEVFSLPFMTADGENSSVAMWKAVQQIPDLKEEYSDVHLLWINCHKPGFFNTTKKPIRTLDDLKGMKIRTASTFVTGALQELGAVPVTITIGETYTSLERGLVDGTMIGYDGMTTFKLEEVLRFGTRADFYTMPFWGAMNKKVYDRMPKDIQEIIDANSGEALSRKAGKSFDMEYERNRKSVRAGNFEEIFLSDADLEKMKNIILPLKQQWADDMTAKGFKGQFIMDTATRLLADEM